MTSFIVVLVTVVGIVNEVGGRSRGWDGCGWAFGAVVVCGGGFLLFGCFGLVPGMVMEVFLVVRSTFALIQSPKFWSDFFREPLLRIQRSQSLASWETNPHQ